MNQSAVHRVLGDAFADLPREVREAHDHEGVLVLVGKADAVIGLGWFGRTICGLIGLPGGGIGQRVSVSLETDANGIDFWQRDFAGRQYRSHLSAKDGLLVERMGLVTNTFRLEAFPNRLALHLTGFALLGVELPRGLSARCQAIESAEKGGFKFDITIDLPLFGRLIHYCGVIRRG